MATNNRTHSYFASDFHLGVNAGFSSIEREIKVVAWLKSIKHNAKAIFLVGDLFDYWFEYKYVVPKGYSRLFGTLAELTDHGIEIHFLKGNHDLWVYEYFQKELNIYVHNQNHQVKIDGQLFYLTHGDGLGTGDYLYKIIKKILRNRFAQYIFSCLHPSLGMPLMKYVSRRSRIHENRSDIKNHHESLTTFAKRLHSKHAFKFFICGHLHDPIVVEFPDDKFTYCNLGDWITHFTYGVWDGKCLELNRFETTN